MSTTHFILPRPKDEHIRCAYGMSGRWRTRRNVPAQKAPPSFARQQFLWYKATAPKMPNFIFQAPSSPCCHRIRALFILPAFSDGKGFSDWLIWWWDEIISTQKDVMHRAPLIGLMAITRRGRAAGAKMTGHLIYLPFIIYDWYFSWYWFINLASFSAQIYTPLLIADICYDG